MNKRIMTCEKHGDFTQEEHPHPMAELWNRPTQTLWIGHCVECENEKSESEKQKEAEIVRGNRDRLRLNAGVSIRNLNKTFADYVSELGSKQDAAKAKFMALSESLLSGNGFNIIACGGVGTGKTLLACALVDSICHRKNVKIITIMDLIRELKDTWKKGSDYSEREIIDIYCNFDLLIIDEVGVQFGSDTERLFIFDIINGRYENMKPTVLLSNLSIDLVKEVIGERVIDRLRDDGGKLVVFDWESQRGKK